MIVPKRLFTWLRRAASDAAEGDRGQLGIFMVLVLGAVALVVVSITLMLGMQIAGGFGVTGDSFSVDGEEFTQDEAAPFEYQVDRHPGTDDVLELDDSVTVVNETDSSELSDSEYTWFADNGTVRVEDGTTTTGDTYSISYSGQEHEYASSAQSTEGSTGSAFSLFGTSVLVIPASAVLAVLIGGLVGAIGMRGQMPGLNNGGGRNRRR